MSEPSKRPRLRKFIWAVVATVALLGAILAAPFLFTTRLALLAVRQSFPGNHPALASARLSASGELVLQGLILYDVGAAASAPLISIHELRIDFYWAELLSRRIRRARINDLVVYARSNSETQFSLLDLYFDHFRAAAPGAMPLWVDDLNITGAIHREALTGISPASNLDWPVLLKIAMSGDRRNPARQIDLKIGEIGGPAALASSRPDHDAAFGLRTELQTQPIANGTSVIVRLLAVKNAALAIETELIRKFVAKLPEEMKGRVEAGVADLSGSGKLDLQGQAGNKLSGDISFIRVRLLVPGGSQTILSVEDFSGALKIDTPFPFSSTTSLRVDRLEAKDFKLSARAETLRQYLPKLPREVSGRVEVSSRNVSIAGGSNLDASGRRQMIANLSIAAGHILIPGESQTFVKIDDISGAARINSSIPPGVRSSIAIDRLQAKQTSTSLDADLLRRYLTNLPSDLHGHIDAGLDELDISGLIDATPRHASFSGIARIQNLNAGSAPDVGKHPFALERFTLTGAVESPLDHFDATGARVRDGRINFATLTYGNNSIRNFDASWHADGRMLACDLCTLEIFDGQVAGSPAFDLATHEMPPADLAVHHIDVHQALANLSPDHLDADGVASGALHLRMNQQRDLSGSVDLVFDGPGLLKIGEIEEVKQMLAGNFGLDMANLAMRDLRHFPFKEGRLHLESAQRNTQLKIRFVRQARSAADAVTPHKEIINGKEVLVGSLVVPTIDMTIPITGKSLAEILATVSGLHPTVAAVGEPSNK